MPAHRHVLRCAPVAALLAAALACSGSGQPGSRAAGGTAAATSGGGTPSGAASSSEAFPTFRYPESLAIQIRREVSARRMDDKIERYRELLSCDGGGNVAVVLEAYQPPEYPAWIEPPPLPLIGQWEWRQRFLVFYREMHVRDVASLRACYDWTEVTQGGPFLVAGEECRKFRASSQNGFGSVELYASKTDDLLLAWTLFDALDVEQQSVVATELSRAPDLSGVEWAEPLGQKPYRGEIDNPTLGFAPLHPVYLPEAFSSRAQFMLLLESWGLNNFHVEMLHDGLQVLFIVQERVEVPSGGGGTVRATAVRACSSGGIQVVEGAILDRKVTLVSSLPTDELVTIFTFMAE